MKHTDITSMFVALSQHGLHFDRPGVVPDATPVRVGVKRAFYPPHEHTQLEAIYLVDGSLKLYVNDVWFVWESPQTRVFVPGTVHTEHYTNQRTPYRLLWITLFPSALFLHITAYHPLTGYSTSFNRMAIAPPSASELWRLSRQPDFPAAAVLRARFHALLMQSLHHALLTPETAMQQPADVQDRIIGQIKEYIQRHYNENLSLERMATLMHYSKGHLNAMFRRVEKMPLHRFISEIRLRKARQLLEEGGMLVKQVALAVGFDDPLYFSRLFRKRFAIRPSDITIRRKRRVGRRRQRQET